MKKKSFVKKIIGSALVLSLPLSVSTGTALLAKADNNNFSSGTSTNYISTSFSGWSGLNNDGKTTAGIIDVGSSFNKNRASTYFLENNPGAKSSDNKVLMICILIQLHDIIIFW